MQTMTIHRQSSRSTLPHHHKPTQSSNGADPHDELFRSRETSGRLRDKDGFQLFPRSHGITNPINAIVECFKDLEEEISSDNYKYSSNEVLEILRPKLEHIGYDVEKGKSKNEKIHVPVLFGYNNQIDKSFNADALSVDNKIVVEVEAGRAVDNNQFLKDIFQACMMFEVEYLVIAVRNNYRGADDFSKIFTFLETLYISSRLQLPLKGILLIGY